MVGRQREGKMEQKCGAGNLIFMTSGYTLMRGTERVGKLCATAEGGKTGKTYRSGVETKGILLCVFITVWFTKALKKMDG